MNERFISGAAQGLLCLLLSAGPALGQVSDRKTVQLDALIAEALSNNPELASVHFEAEKERYRIGPAGTYEDPVVGFEAMSYPWDTLSSREFGMTGNRVSLTQAIPFPGKRTLQRKGAKYDFESKRAQFEAARLALIRTVKLIYFDLYFAYRTNDILAEQLKIVRQLIPVARSRYTLGKVPQAVVLGLQVEEADLLDQTLKSDKEINVKVGDLNHALGRAQHHELGGKPVRPKKTELDFTKVTEKEIADTIVAKAPSLGSTEAEFRSTQARLSFARLDYLPNFEFSFAYTQRNPSPGDRGVDFISGGIGISIPLWAVTKQSKEVKAARADRDRAAAMVREERLHLFHMVHTLYAELEEAAKRLKLYEGGLLPLANQSVITARSAFRAGQFEYASLLDLIRKRFLVELGLVEALAKYESKIAELEALSGVSLEELQNERRDD